MDRFWLLTWTTYGAWLPGDKRGFVSPVHDDSGCLVLHNIHGTPVMADVPSLREHARSLLKCPPIYLNQSHADALPEQFEETANIREWTVLAGAVMSNHTHLVVGVPGDPDPEKLLHDFKSYATRKLNKQFGRPKSDTWWTESGSKRVLKGEEAVRNAIIYVRDQAFALRVWLHPMAIEIIGAMTGPARQN